jgi:hypothetical protein
MGMTENRCQGSIEEVEKVLWMGRNISKVCEKKLLVLNCISFNNIVTCLLHVATLNLDSPDSTREFI